MQMLSEHPFTHTLQLLEHWLGWDNTYTQVWRDGQSLGIFNCKTTAGEIQPWLLADLGAESVLLHVCCPSASHPGMLSRQGSSTAPQHDPYPGNPAGFPPVLQVSRLPPPSLFSTFFAPLAASSLLF